MLIDTVPCDSEDLQEENDDIIISEASEDNYQYK